MSQHIAQSTMASQIEEHASTHLEQNRSASGNPGAKPTWSSGAKTAVGTALSTESRVWFTISRGVLNELYFPDVDCANMRVLRYVVTDGKDFFSDEQVDTEHDVSWIESGVPAFRIVNRCKRGRYSITTEIVADPVRDVVLLETLFEPAKTSDELRLYVVCDPHMRDRGNENNGWVGCYKSIPMLFAQRDGLALALASSARFARRTCGFVGKSDGLRDLRKHRRLTRCFTQANNGNISLTAEIDWRVCRGSFRLACAFGGDPAEAGQQARAGLLQDFETVKRKFIESWQAAQDKCLDLPRQRAGDLDLYRASIAVMRTHESKRFPGGFVASLSIPWGFDRSDSATGGYHVLWPRDNAEIVLGLLACGDAESARRALFYLHCTQEADGNWPQNMWLDGTAHWTSTQMDGTSFGILIADSLRRREELGATHPWAMVKAAAAFLVQNGPLTKQDRWEANPGYSPYTMAVQIAALLAAADFAEAEGEHSAAHFLRVTADAWNDAVDELTYISGTKLARKFGAKGYYFRILPPEGICRDIRQTKTALKNHARGWRLHRAVDVVSPDALALVRFGLRSAHDPRILDTIKLIDATLKTETATGPTWHRYTDDGYGEHTDGAPFDGTGVGRGWPLLTGERAHYAIAAGNLAEAQKLSQTMEAQVSECGMLPEQIWDARDIPKRDLFNGHPTGSGMPLVWAHAEYVKLLRSIQEKAVWNTPPQTQRRYLFDRKTSGFQIWTPKQQRARVAAGKNLRVDCFHPASIRWSADKGHSPHRIETVDSGLGVHWALLPVDSFTPGARIRFALDPPPAGAKNIDVFEVVIVA